MFAFERTYGQRNLMRALSDVYLIDRPEIDVFGDVDKLWFK